MNGSRVSKNQQVNNVMRATEAGLRFSLGAHQPEGDRLLPTGEVRVWAHVLVCCSPPLEISSLAGSGIITGIVLFGEQVCQIFVLLGWLHDIVSINRKVFSEGGMDRVIDNNSVSHNPVAF